MKLLIGIITALALMVPIVGCKTYNIDLRTQRDPDKALKSQPEYSEQLRQYFSENNRHYAALPNEGETIRYESYGRSIGWSDSWVPFTQDQEIEHNRLMREYYHRIWKTNFIKGITIAVLLSALIILLAAVFARWLVKEKVIIQSFHKWSDYDSAN